MAVKFAIRNYARVGNNVTFTVIALNANGSVDTNFTGTVAFNSSNLAVGAGQNTFTAGNMGQRVVTATILDAGADAFFVAMFPGTGDGTNLMIAGPASVGLGPSLSGDHLLVGGSGNDFILANTGNELILLDAGGNDRVEGGAGADGFYFGAAYTIDDRVTGGSGDDQLALQGDYAAATAVGNMNGVEQIVLLPGNDNRFGGGTGAQFSYNLVMTSSIVATNNKLIVQANTLRAGENFTFDGSATAIDYLIYGGLGTDNLTGGTGNDGFFFGQGRFGASDVVNGGGGTLDQIGFQGNFTFGNGRQLAFGASQLSGIEFIVLLSAVDTRFGAGGGVARYDLVMADGNVAAGQQLTIQANVLGVDEALTFDGILETDGSFRVYGGAAGDFIRGGRNADEIFGGAGADSLRGDGGADMLTGGAGNDIFSYFFVSDSTAAARDRILDFTTGDTINLFSLAINTGGGNFVFIGDGPQTGARQLQVLQNGNAATVNVFVDGDANPDLVIDVTVADGHTLTLADFTGAMAPMDDVVSLAGKLMQERDSILFLGEFGGRDKSGFALAPRLDEGPVDDTSLPDLAFIGPRLELGGIAPTNDFLV